MANMSHVTAIESNGRLPPLTTDNHGMETPHVIQGPAASSIVCLDGEIAHAITPTSALALYSLYL